jgi:hypothetical protein
MFQHLRIVPYGLVFQCDFGCKCPPTAAALIPGYRKQKTAEGRLGGIESRRVFEQGHEAFLNNIFRGDGILEDPAGEAIHCATMVRPEDVKSIFVTACGARDVLLFRVHDLGLT